jgi:uncharacterized membrane protein
VITIIFLAVDNQNDLVKNFLQAQIQSVPTAPPVSLLLVSAWNRDVVAIRVARPYTREKEVRFRSATARRGAPTPYFIPFPLVRREADKRNRKAAHVGDLSCGELALIRDGNRRPDRH